MPTILANKFCNNVFKGTFLLSTYIEDDELELKITEIKNNFIDCGFVIDKRSYKNMNGFLSFNKATNEKIIVIIKSDINEELDMGILLNLISN